MQILRSSVLILLTGLCVLFLSATANVEVEERDILDVTCKSDLDLIFLVDGSDAVPDRGWGQLRGWLTSLMNVFSISTWQTRVGIIQMGDQARFEIKLSGNATAVAETAESMFPLKSSKTDFRGGLQLASSELLTNFRPGVPRVVVILSNTDQSTDSGAISVANTLRSQLTDVIVVAVGSDVNSEFLSALATDPRSTYLTTSGFSRLAQVQNSLIVKLCVRLDRLEPSSGPTSGGTAVRVFGSGFTPGLACYFGTQYSQATFVDSRSIVCRSIAQLYPSQQNVSVAVTPNNVDFAIRNLTFAYEMQCPNGCSSRGVCIHGACLCDQGWTGIDCSSHSMNPNTTCPNNCNGNGWCNNGMCQCYSGWTGYDCSVNNNTSTCPNDCNGRGWCNNGTCQCNWPWTGYDCSSNTTNSCPNNCNGRGWCDNGYCQCYSGWTGYDCSQNTTVSSCPNNCNGNGWCNNGTCQCNWPWTGYDCSSNTTNSCPNNCNGRGWCNNGMCQCYSGWTGYDCSVNNNTSTCPNDCNGRGWCNNGTCQCNWPWTGYDCSSNTTNSCPNNCNGRGWCNNGMCQCYPGWTGYDCNQNTTVSSCPNNCNGNGWCNNSTCYCNFGYTGYDCSIVSLQQQWLLFVRSMYLQLGLDGQ
eukprot:TRINITY_DN5814_c0_g1_i2.p1 TRINITY_DN5814_c0_g1~~TRINITY_DN5814_c0_g1_i2.p1  ORF type:complete len:637 (-),score=69.75 TRINITY_DN5814_c0_g1_i2:256-2166(-)